MYAGAVWGLFWIPLGAVEKAGIDALWITVVYFLIPQFVSFPLYYCDFPMSKMAGFHCSSPEFYRVGLAALFHFNCLHRSCASCAAFLSNTNMGNIFSQNFRGDDYPKSLDCDGFGDYRHDNCIWS